MEGRRWDFIARKKGKKSKGAWKSCKAREAPRGVKVISHFCALSDGGVADFGGWRLLLKR